MACMTHAERNKKKILETLGHDGYLPLAFRFVASVRMHRENASAEYIDAATLRTLHSSFAKPIEWRQRNNKSQSSIRNV